MRPAGRWAATFSKFPPGPTPLIGPIEVRVADWSQPQPGRAPMFDIALLERLSVAHPAFHLRSSSPAGLFLWRALAAGLRRAVAGGVPRRAAAWTLLEYAAHRGSFHHVPTPDWQVAYGYLVHGVHHAYPDDSRRWMLPLIVTVPIALPLFASSLPPAARHRRCSAASSTAI